MDHKTYVMMTEVMKADDIRRCEWCNTWKPDKEVVPKSDFLGKVTCWNCYRNFRIIKEKKDIVEALLKWAEKAIKDFNDI